VIDLDDDNDDGDDDVSAAGDDAESATSWKLVEGRPSRLLLHRQLQLHLAAVSRWSVDEYSLKVLRPTRQQNRSFRRRSFQPVCWLGTEETKPRTRMWANA